ncbi:hypothetical protein [Psychrobacillus sp. OK032]|uniref:hypothetical protein n=1 Tax=Psychrobacillus sp. OK032 TaxID=1884358 RepID=UPI0008BD0A55|nr:hypothetical protein [Psychrobacillus sp. OK032]SER88281.1 hypothetical protein SAMN05518872_102485 [Psychrobacillus sp. OK032]
MKTYNPTVHAVEQARIRFGVAEEDAKAWFNQLMETALYVTTQTPSKRKVYKNSGIDAMIVLDPKDDVIVTILPKHGDGVKAKVKFSATNAIISKARATIKRELTKAQRQFVREFRTLSERQALVQIEIAQLTLNKVRAKNPKTQASIQTNIDVALGMFDEIGKALDELRAEYERTKREADAFLTI